MKKTDYFKITFISVAAGLFAGQIVYSLLTRGIPADVNGFGKLILKSLCIGLFTGLTLGLLNMYLKITLTKKNG